MKNDSIELLLLDLDGVLIDSLDETYIVSGNAHFGTEWDPKSSILKKLFKDFRYLVGPPEDYQILWTCIEEEGDQLEAIELNFLERKGALDPNSQEGFKEQFFREREKLWNKDPVAWLGLHSIQSGVTDVFKNYWPIVITTKNRDASARILQHFNLKTQEIWANEDFRQKSDAVRHILSNRAVEKDKVLFVDDHSQHLEDVSSLGVKVAWASWGYGSSSKGFKTLKSFYDLEVF